MFNPNIHDESIHKVNEVSPSSSTESVPSSKTDSGLSSIEKSKSVSPATTPASNAPILIAPSEQQSLAFVVTGLDSMGKPVAETMSSFILQMDQIKSTMLEGWSKNLREIEEYVRQMLSSPLYQQLQEIRQKGDPSQGIVSGVEGVNAANAAAQKSVGIISTISRAQRAEQVPETSEAEKASEPKESTAQVIVVPLTAALLMGAGFALNSIQSTSGVNPASSSMESVFKFVERLQPLFPQVGIRDLVPFINLMVIGPIYYNSWNEAISNFKNKERHSYVQTAQNFAKDVIKLLSDPTFIRLSLIKNMKGTDQLSEKDQNRLATVLKIVLIGVALSLLYSVEVGKVQNGKFGGIEPEELRDLITGKLTERTDSSKKLTEQEFLTDSLIARAREQLSELSQEDREQAATLLLEYVTQHRDFDPMLDPAKIFEETLESSSFNPRDKINMFKA